MEAEGKHRPSAIEPDVGLRFADADPCSSDSELGDLFKKDSNPED